ncbi:LemA family protein [Lyngbya sp. CCY1209]|uniref:LemA family protein n=1 Tax=Lyngbya sp. CCY1209 TaxID=2886103 RepID=UPI002D208340|nr:LemA family protein [Lyngbya sp. CCY1209]MEB3884211.1 LemA family protein [Lyngbya sp. CCY1209]
MSESDVNIPEELAPEVLEVASRLYQEASDRYSLAELQEAGEAVSIPPELIETAIAQVREKRRLEEIARRQAQQRKSAIIGIGVALGGAIALWGVFAYNSLSGKYQQVQASWAQVENQLQRRADLIPQLLAVTEAQADQERDIVRLLTESRQQFLQAKSTDEKLAAMAEMNSAIQQFNQYAIAAPELRSSQAFINLQYEIAGTENRIATERRRYNQAVQSYNQNRQRFPTSVVGGLFGFDRQPFFQAENTEVPKIE